MDAFNPQTFTIQSGLHVRIIPGVMSGFQHVTNEQLFIIQNGGHLLFGDPDKPITVDCSMPREQHLFELVGAGSLVLRNITVKNASAGGAAIPSNAALVFSGATAGKSTVVLEEFKYLEDTPLSVQSTLPALQISMGSEHHFVSGGITGFNVSDPAYGGVATFYGGGILFLYPGVVLSGNSEYMGSSITGVPPGVLYDNR